MTERESKIKWLRQRIKNLENKPHKSPEEEQELRDKKTELAQLEQEKNNNTNNHDWPKPTLIIGGILAVGITMWIIISKKNKKSHH